MSTRTMKNGAQWTVRKGYESITDKINLDDFRSALNGNTYKTIKETKVRSVISIPGSDVNKNGIYIKYFKRGGYSDYVKYLLVPTRTRTEWKVANELFEPEYQYCPAACNSREEKIRYAGQQLACYRGSHK